MKDDKKVYSKEDAKLLAIVKKLLIKAKKVGSTPDESDWIEDAKNENLMKKYEYIDNVNLTREAEADEGKEEKDRIIPQYITEKQGPVLESFIAGLEIDLFLNSWRPPQLMKNVIDLLNDVLGKRRSICRQVADRTSDREYLFPVVFVRHYHIDRRSQIAR